MCVRAHISCYPCIKRKNLEMPLHLSRLTESTTDKYIYLSFICFLEHLKPNPRFSAHFCHQRWHLPSNTSQSNTPVGCRVPHSRKLTEKPLMLTCGMKRTAAETRLITFISMCDMNHSDLYFTLLFKPPWDPRDFQKNKQYFNLSAVLICLKWAPLQKPGKRPS